MAFALGSVVVLVGAQLAGYELSVVTEDLASYRSLTQATGLDRSYLHRDGRNTVASVTTQPRCIYHWHNHITHLQSKDTNTISSKRNHSHSAALNLPAELSVGVPKIASHTSPRTHSPHHPSVSPPPFSLRRVAARDTPVSH